MLLLIGHWPACFLRGPLMVDTLLDNFKKDRSTTSRVLWGHSHMLGNRIRRSSTRGLNHQHHIVKRSILKHVYGVLNSLYPHNKFILIHLCSKKSVSERALKRPWHLNLQLQTTVQVIMTKMFLPRSRCGRTCSRSDPRPKCPSPLLNTGHRAPCTRPARAHTYTDTR